VPRFEKIEPGDEQILDEREQRDRDAVPSFLALCADEHASGEPERPSGWSSRPAGLGASTAFGA
jgi:hypothetical protein